MKDCKKEFENWYAPEYIGNKIFDVNSGGYYIHRSTYNAYEAFKAGFNLAKEQPNE